MERILPPPFTLQCYVKFPTLANLIFSYLVKLEKCYFGRRPAGLVGVSESRRGQQVPAAHILPARLNSHDVCQVYKERKCYFPYPMLKIRMHWKIEKHICFHVKIIYIFCLARTISVSKHFA